jgi:hypothetical protein
VRDERFGVIWYGEAQREQGEAKADDDVAERLEAPNEVLVALAGAL